MKMLGKKRIELKQLFESDGAEVFVQKITGLLEGEKPELTPEDFSLRELHEAVDVSTFSIITGSLVSTKVMEAYTAAAKIGDRLVSSFNSGQLIDKVPGVHTTGLLDDITSGGNYPHSGGAAETYVTITGNKRGAILDVDEDAVKFDQTGLILRRASEFGTAAGVDREKRILYTIQDATVGGKNYYAWYPSGSRTVLYSTSTTAPHNNSNLVTNKLVDFTDLEAADLALGSMKDDNDESIDIVAKILLVPRALKVTGLRLINNTVMPGGGNNEANPFNGAVEVIASGLLNDVSTVCWYWGDFQRQYAEKVVYPIQVLSRTMSDNNSDAWERDVIASYKVRHYTQVGAVDHRCVVKSNGTV
jgi:hypothetical protein